ncbi:MAG: hypothetical protein ACE5FI_06380 [Anaerolineales bacterium]
MPRPNPISLLYVDAATGEALHTNARQVIAAQQSYQEGEGYERENNAAAENEAPIRQNRRRGIAGAAIIKIAG